MHGDDDRAQKPYKILKASIQVTRPIYVVWVQDQRKSFRSIDVYLKSAHLAILLYFSEFCCKMLASSYLCLIKICFYVEISPAQFCLNLCLTNRHKILPLLTSNCKIPLLRKARIFIEGLSEYSKFLECYRIGEIQFRGSKKALISLKK